MNAATQHTQKIDPFPSFADYAGLEHLAFEGRNEEVFEIIRRNYADQEVSYQNKSIMLAVMQGGIPKLHIARKRGLDDLERELIIFLGKGVRQFMDHCRDTKFYPRELFRSIFIWGEALSDLSYFEDALSHYEEALALGMRNSPDYYLKFLAKKGEILFSLGRLQDSRRILSYLADRLYLFSDRNLVPDVILNLGKSLLSMGEVDLFKEFLSQGIRRFYTDFRLRKDIVNQLAIAYGPLYRVLFAKEIKTSDKILFLIHRLGYALHGQKYARPLGIRKLVKWGVLGYVYFLNYFRAESSPTRYPSLEVKAENHVNTPALPQKNSFSHKPRILITRAMGGIGDLLMMTPGLHGLRKKFRQGEVHFAIPKKYFPLFKGNDDVFLIDIEEENIDLLSYDKWMNLTDCPAARMESRTAPRVRGNRIDIFARAMGVRGLNLLRMDRKPRYFISQEEREFREGFWRQNNLNGKRVVGIQLYAAESYRDYPHMQHLIDVVSREMMVLLFNDEVAQGYDGPNIIKIDSSPLRHVIALAAGCSALIVPDSMFLHLAGALDIPCIVLTGPIDGKVRAKYYPSCQFIDARASLGCVPCWRNEDMPCKLSGMRESACMAAVSVDRIYKNLIQAVNKIPERPGSTFPPQGDHPERN